MGGSEEEMSGEGRGKKKKIEHFVAFPETLNVLGQFRATFRVREEFSANRISYLIVK